MKAVLVLEDGTVFEGNSFGAEGEAAGEVVFNTQIIGYQEILTDPAYGGKMVAMGYPHIGNYGINDRCFESDSTHAQALIVKEYSKIYSNWQATGSLGEFMKKNGVVGIEGIDTRSLTIYIREHGEMRGVVSTKTADVKKLVEKAKAYDAKLQAPSSKSQTSSKSQSTNVIIDIGVNKSTLAKYERAVVVSSAATADQILKMQPEEVILSSGPGDPRELKGLIAEVKKLVGQVKLTGIQNGACVLAMALGCTVSKMKVGHHGMNIPVVDPKTGKGEISMQNHSYGFDKLSKEVKVAHVNLNDKTVEKIVSLDGKCQAALYYPIDERGKLDPGYKRV